MASDFWSPPSPDGQRYGLSPMQFSAMIGTRNVFLEACPGSGKTTAVAGRVAWLHQQGAKLALISFTNTGADEMSRKLQQDHGVSLSGAGFSGTIHAFLQKYVLTPFAHMLTGGTAAVRIDPEMVRLMDPPNIDTTRYTYHSDGRLGHNDPSKPLDASDDISAVAAAKHKSALSGFVTANDAIYWSVRVLAEVPGAAAALATRFDEIIVDEAQDTSRLQLWSLSWIKSHGLGSLVLVGDYDQSIYAFNGASTDDCKDSAKKWGLQTQPLTENYRSSQKICDAAGRLRGAAPPDTAVGVDKDCTTPPLVFQYSPGDEHSIGTRFQALAAMYRINPNDAVVLAATNATCAQIRGERLDLLPRDLSLLFEAKSSKGGPTMAMYRAVERLLRRLAFGARSITDVDPLHVRNLVVQLIVELPSPEGGLRDWAETSVRVTDSLVQELAAMPESLLARELRDSLPDLDQTYSPTRGEQVRVSTVHGVKGESIDAVALVMSAQTLRQRQYGYPGPAGELAACLADPTISTLSKDESIRRSYVAMTRARKLLAIGIPSSDDPSVLQNFLRAGFQLVP